MHRPCHRLGAVLLLALVALAAAAAPPAETASPTRLREDFADLHQWQPLTFPKIPRHSRYRSVIEDGVTALEGDAENSASGLIWQQRFDVYRTPILRWRWKVTNVLAQGDARRKAGDDYALRIYVIFAYNPKAASYGQRLKYGLAKKLYGKYPPHSGLNYVWANRRQPRRIIPNAFTGQARMVLLRQDAAVATWYEERVNILADYRKAFGENPPHEASLAIMSDADNTGGKTGGYVDYIELSALEPPAGAAPEPGAAP